jgi:hypothetical protein
LRPRLVGILNPVGLRAGIRDGMGRILQMIGLKYVKAKHYSF